MNKQAVMPKVQDLLDARGVSRRSFVKLCCAIGAAAGLSELATPKVEKALADTIIGASEGDLYPVIWIEGASCTGCTESFAQVETPDAASIVLEMISLNYSETLSAAAGYSMEEAKARTIEAGNYLLIYEGAVLKGWEGNALRVAGLPGTEHLVEAASNANAVIALGSCAVNGGWMCATPNSADALGVQQYLEEAGVSVPVVNIPGCPANPEWLVSVLVDVVLMKLAPADLDLNSQGKPAGIFDQTVHDNCERRGHFENGEFVYEFGSEEEALGYCLYPLGCRGPQTKSNCGVVMWNNRRSWCVQAGSPCIGCCEADPRNPNDNWVEKNTPFYKRHRDFRIGNFTVRPDVIALGLTGLVAGALVIHGFGMKATGRMDGGADFEDIRAWDAKHPSKSIGKYDPEVVAAAEGRKNSTRSDKEEGR
jgi:hydrogenase small subunit